MIRRIPLQPKTLDIELTYRDLDDNQVRSIVIEVDPEKFLHDYIKWEADECRKYNLKVERRVKKPEDIQLHFSAGALRMNPKIGTWVNDYVRVPGYTHARTPDLTKAIKDNIRTNPGTALARPATERQVAGAYHLAYMQDARRMRQQDRANGVEGVRFGLKPIPDPPQPQVQSLRDWGKRFRD